MSFVHAAFRPWTHLPLRLKQKTRCTLCVSVMHTAPFARTVGSQLSPVAWLMIGVN